MANRTVEIKGLKELDERLKKFDDNVQRNIMRGAMRAGGKVFLDEAKTRVPVKSGQLRNSLRMSGGVDDSGLVSAIITAGSTTKVYNSRGRAIKNEPIFEIAPSGKKKYKTAFYASMVEFGTKSHIISAKPPKSVLSFMGINRSKVEHPGSEARPFMRPTFDFSGVVAFETVADYLRKRIEKQESK